MPADSTPLAQAPGDLWANAPLPGSNVFAASATPPSRRRRVIFLAIAALVLLGAAGTAYVLLRQSTESKFVAALHDAHIANEYPSDDAAVAHAKAFCRELAGGHEAVGWDSERIAVQYFCKSFLPGFKVIPTPAQQQAQYLTALRDAGFGGKFASDAAAVAHANSVCTRLRDGGPQQGMPVDQIAVDHYCTEFSSGFHVLETRTIRGHFTLYDSSGGGGFFPSIVSFGRYCSGDNGYSDITPGTEVTVTGPSGRLLAQTQLGRGKGGGSVCRFGFSVRLTEGSKDYSVSVSHRGSIHFTWAELTNRGIELSLGD